MEEDIDLHTLRTIEIVIGNRHKIIANNNRLWTVFVTTPNNWISSIINTVGIKITPSIKNTFMWIDKPPFELDQIGLGEFKAIIEITTVDRNLYSFEHNVILKGEGGWNTYQISVLIPMSSSSKKVKKRGSKLLSPKVDRRRIPLQEPAILVSSNIPPKEGGNTVGDDESESPRQHHQVSLKEDEIEVFKQNGHVNIKNCITLKDMLNAKAKLNILITNLKRNNVKVKPEIHNVWVKTNHFKKFIQNTNLASIAAKLLGVNSVRLYHDTFYISDGINHNENFEEEDYWIRDSITTPFPKFAKVIKAWIPLSEMTKDSSSVICVDSSHKLEQGHWRAEIPIATDESTFDTYTTDRDTEEGTDKTEDVVNTEIDDVSFEEGDKRDIFLSSDDIKMLKKKSSSLLDMSHLVQPLESPPPILNNPNNVIIDNNNNNNNNNISKLKVKPKKQIRSKNKNRNIYVTLPPNKTKEITVHKSEMGDVIFTDFHTLYKPVKYIKHDMICIVYYSAKKMKLIPPKDYQKNDYLHFWSGLRPGDDAFSPLNPILFEESDNI